MSKKKEQQREKLVELITEYAPRLFDAVPRSGVNKTEVERLADEILNDTR